MKWRSEEGCSASHRDFFAWYRKHYPDDYALLL